MIADFYLWTGFIVFVFIMLALDLGVFHRKSHEVKIREALIWSAVWISLALIFNYGIFIFMGREKAIEFCEMVKPIFMEIRSHVDDLELYVEDQYWPLPKYREILFNR